MVSSVGADASTRNFYLRTKADMEAAISSMPFHAVHIFRPSLLFGPTGPRPGERIGIALAKAIEFALVGHSGNRGRHGGGGNARGLMQRRLSFIFTVTTIC